MPTKFIASMPLPFHQNKTRLEAHLLLIVPTGGSLTPTDNGPEPLHFKYFLSKCQGTFGTKSHEFLDSVYTSNHNIYCITETWLNDCRFSHNIFPVSCSVFHADRDYLNSSTTCGGGGGGALIAVSKLFHSVKWRLDLEIINECVWIEIPTRDNNLLLGNHYIAPDSNVKIIENYLNFLKQNFNMQQY
jgi:hypothetical protein